MTISPQMAAGIATPENPEITVQLLEISHSAWGQTYRLCNHNTDIVHNGNTYTAWAFQIPLISEAQGDIPKPALVLDNVSTGIAAAIKAVAGKRERVTVVAKLVSVAQPDYIQRGPTTFRVRSVKCNVFQVVAVLTLLAVEFDAIPRKKIDPTNFPGSFGVIR